MANGCNNSTMLLYNVKLSTNNEYLLQMSKTQVLNVYQKYLMKTLTDVDLYTIEFIKCIFIERDNCHFLTRNECNLLLNYLMTG